MVSKLCRLVCLLIAVPVVAVPVHAKAALVPRIALVIGNGAYQEFPALRNSVNDANLMARTLRGLGFEVVQRTDANRDAMVTAIRTFRDKIKSAGRQPVGLFYYAGHGVEWEGRNYLIPLNAGIKVEEDLEFRAVVAQSILHQLLNSDPALTLMILDACRDNPLPSRSRSGNGGLGFMGTDRQVQNAIIAFAAAPKQKAQDGPPGGNSPYTAALVTEMTRQPRSEIGMVFRRTTDAVSEQTNKEQRPWINSTLGSALFYFQEDGQRRDPGVYLAVNVTRGKKIEPAQLNEIRRAEISSREIRNYGEIAGGCYTRSIQSGVRLEWDHVSANCFR